MKKLIKIPVALMPLGNVKPTLFSGLLACTLMCMISVKAFAENSVINFELAPKQCIALHHGQTCFVDIEITWNATERDDLCLFSSQQHKPLMCWQQVRQGQYFNEIESAENVSFYLKSTADTPQILATAQLEMAWVYKKNVRSRASWRMF
ncbi:DUF3019 domain-containing protein [Thalassotalea atypica]|uniref:DUF3019 domain-containing protein n=1 Tax=Thalassotalea atypica TaxID=2054316 RepID=UPI0025726CD2|nr:DUF3019 domain-containing protein [Thalassotalea atypica]